MKFGMDIILVKVVPELMLNCYRTVMLNLWHSEVRAALEPQTYGSEILHGNKYPKKVIFISVFV
jgi:hypothetical protein